MFGAIGGFLVFIIIAVIILFILSSCIRIVPQAQALVVEDVYKRQLLHPWFWDGVPALPNTVP